MTKQAAARDVPAAGESDASARTCVTSGWRSQWPLPSPRTTAHSARRRQGPGRGGARVELHGDDPEQLPPQGRVLRHVVGHLSVPSLTGSRRSGRRSMWCWTSSGRMIVCFPSRLSKCPRSCLMMSPCELRFAIRSWRNSWWKCRRSYPFPRCSGWWSRTWPFQFLVVEGDSQVFKGFPPEQSSTATHSSKKRISERIVVQFVDIPGGGLQGFCPVQSSSASPSSPAGVHENADEPGEGVFRTYPQGKKVRRLPGRSVRTCPGTSAHGLLRLMFSPGGPMRRRRRTSCSLYRHTSGHRRSGPGFGSSSAPPPRRGGGSGRRGGFLKALFFVVSLVLALLGLGNLDIFSPLVSGSLFVAGGVRNDGLFLGDGFMVTPLVSGSLSCLWCALHDSGYIFTSVSMYSASCLVRQWIHGHASIYATFGRFFLVVFPRPHTTPHHTTPHHTTPHHTTQHTTPHHTTPHHTTPHHTTQHNTTQHNTTQHNTTQHNTTQHNTTQHNTTQHNTTQHNTTQHNTTQHNTTQHNTTQHNTTQHNPTQPNTTHGC